MQEGLRVHARDQRAEKEACEACGGKLERLISTSGFVLKGGGWYKDLYSSSKKPDSGGSKTETKSEAKSETKSSSSTSSSSSSDSSGGKKD